MASPYQGKKKTYLIGHLDCKTNQVGTQAGGDDQKRKKPI